MWSFFFIPLPPTKILFLLNFPITTTNDHSIFANGRYQSSLKSWSFSFTRHCLCNSNTGWLFLFCVHITASSCLLLLSNALVQASSSSTWIIMTASYLVSALVSFTFNTMARLSLDKCVSLFTPPH